MLDVEAAAGAERQRLDAPVLRQVLRRFVGVGRHRRRRAADGQPTDGARRREVAFHQRLRHPQQAADVVEAEARVVGRQEVVRLDLHCQQIADGVGVLRAVQAVEGGRTARIAGLRPGAVELALEPSQERLELLRGRPRAAGRRHHAAAQLADHLFPPVGVPAHLGEIERVESQADGAELPDQRRGGAAPTVHHALVVAGDAVAVEQRAVGGAVVRPRRCRSHRRRGDGLGLGRRLLRRRRRGNHPADRKRGHRQEQRHTGLRHEGAPHPLGSRTSHAIGWRRTCQRLPDIVPFQPESRQEGIRRQVRRRVESLDRTVRPGTHEGGSAGEHTRGDWRLPGEHARARRSSAPFVGVSGPRGAGIVSRLPVVSGDEFRPTPGQRPWLVIGILSSGPVIGSYGYMTLTRRSVIKSAGAAGSLLLAGGIPVWTRAEQTGVPAAPRDYVRLSSALLGIESSVMELVPRAGRSAARRHVPCAVRRGRPRCARGAVGGVRAGCGRRRRPAGGRSTPPGDRRQPTARRRGRAGAADDADVALRRLVRRHGNGPYAGLGRRPRSGAPNRHGRLRPRLPQTPGSGDSRRRAPRVSRVRPEAGRSRRRTSRSSCARPESPAGEHPEPPSPCARRGRNATTR